MRALLTITAVLEIATGLALTLSPLRAVSLLLGAAADTSGGEAVTRVAGAALLALGSAFGVARSDVDGRAARGIVAAMLLYNFAAITLLAHAAIRTGMSGSGLWPAASLHLGLAVWCAAGLRMTRANRGV